MATQSGRLRSLNRYFTVLIVPEKTSQVRRLVVPAWLLRGAVIALFFAVALATLMILNYWYVIGQVSENKQLKMENRRLRQQVQVFRNKVSTIDSTLERIKTFSTRLKVITNIEDRSRLLQSLNQQLPDADLNIPPSTAGTGAQTQASATDDDVVTPEQGGLFDGFGEGLGLAREYAELDRKMSSVYADAFLIEQTLQDQYELLADQKAFLLALPTRRPASGYFTSGFGVRRSPYGPGREKMHEGLDIANHPGTPIRATADGLVAFADVKPGYGQTVIIDHGYGLETWYAHARKLLVRRGQKVKRGDLVAQLGNSGRSTGPHLHYEVRVHGFPIDPLSYILED